MVFKRVERDAYCPTHASAMSKLHRCPNIYRTGCLALRLGRGKDRGLPEGRTEGPSFPWPRLARQPIPLSCKRLLDARYTAKALAFLSSHVTHSHDYKRKVTDL